MSVSTNVALDTSSVEKINNPIHQATGLPNRTYTCSEFFTFERERLFSEQWTGLTQACVIPNPGDVCPINWMGIPLVVVRTQNNQVKVFHNVCSHRGNKLVWNTCDRQKTLTCPYHAWSYSLTGDLIGTPHIGGHGTHQIDNFDRSKHGLREVRSYIWMDIVFINLAENQPDFREYISNLEQRFHTLSSPNQYTSLKPAGDSGVLNLEFNANWKLVVENNLESYHLPWVHPSLNAMNRLEDHYHFYGGDLFAGQGTTAYVPDRGNLPQFPRFDPWNQQYAEYPTLFPNVLLGIQSDHFWSIVIQPEKPGRTKERLQIYYLNDGATSDEHAPTRQWQLQSWTKIFKEDVSVVEGMQEGRFSPAFCGGVFSQKMDDPTHHFAKWAANRLG